MNEFDRFAKYENFTKEIPFDLAKHSSIGVGGYAEVAFYPRDELELVRLITQLKDDKIEFYVVGNMTNILPPDGQIKKAIVCIKKLSGVEIGEKTYVAAGTSSSQLLRRLKEARKSGAEFLAGVPCTLGGALYMNAGAGGKYMDEIVENVYVLRDGKIQTLAQNDCEYSYKRSVFMKNDDIILGATLRLEDSDEKRIEENEKRYLDRRAHLPKGKSMGCVFKNPKNAPSAGELIERTGLKGLRVGGAVVAMKHANFILNDRGATEKDIKTLISIIKNAVSAQYKVELEEEIRYLT